jgi:hypothetical protein
LCVNFQRTFTLHWENIWPKRTLHLAGLGIGAAISNTSHTKSVLSLLNEHGSQLQDQVRWQCCYMSIKDFPISLLVQYHYFLDNPEALQYITRMLSVQSHPQYFTYHCS